MNKTKKKRDSHIWARDPHDWYVDPEWCSERLFAAEKFSGAIHDPSCGIGRIVVSARAAGYPTTGADVVPRGLPGAIIINFLDQPIITNRYDNIVTNPPFKHAEQFVNRAVAQVRYKAAFLLPMTWLNGAKRAAWLQNMPLEMVWVLTPRPSMPPGAVVVAGEYVGQGTQDYAWFVFNNGFRAGSRPQIGWLRK